MKLIHFTPNHIVEPAVLIPQIWINIIKSCNSFNSQSSLLKGDGFIFRK